MIPIALGPIPINNDLYSLFTFRSERSIRELQDFDLYNNRRVKQNRTFILEVSVMLPFANSITARDD